MLVVYNTVEPEIFARRNFCQLILPPALIGENFICKYFSHVKECIADMAMFTALAKILSLENYYNTKIAGLDENFIS